MPHASPPAGRAGCEPSGAAALAGFISADALSRLREDLLQRFPDPSAPLLYRRESRAGTVLIGGSATTTWNEDAALILDRGIYRSRRLSQGAGRNAQGAGIYAAVGVLVDERGDDSYDVSFGVAQGLGHDTGFGLFEDETGNDRYRGGTLVRGAATSDGLGILFEGAGKDDFQFLEDSREGGSGLVLVLGNVTRHSFNIQVFQEILCKRPL